MGMDLRGLSKNGRAVHWTLEAAPAHDGWESAEADGWLMTAHRNGTGPELPHRSAAALKITLRSLERRKAVQLRTGTDGRLYARHVNRADVPTETSALMAGTVTVFRKEPDGEVLAVFPYEPGTNDPATCTVFAHFGQHSYASQEYVTGRTRPAAPDEYAALKRELERPPYKYVLDVRPRMPGDAYRVRAAKI